jgi:hypothetical protein
MVGYYCRSTKTAYRALITNFTEQPEIDNDILFVLKLVDEGRKQIARISRFIFYLLFLKILIYLFFKKTF